MSSADNPPSSESFRIAIIGSGPIGKLLACSVTNHPRIEYVQFEADELPLRPSFGYGIGPQTLRTAKLLHPKLGQDLHDRCILSETWMNLYHGGEEDCLIHAVKVPEAQGGLYGRFGRQELLDLLDAHAPEDHETQYGKRLTDLEKLDSGLLELKFEDGSTMTASAVWACDGMNSVCRKFMQGDNFSPATYSDMICYRGKVPAERIVSEIGKEFADESYMIIGIKGWHILVNPIEKGDWINIAAFAIEPTYTRKGREHNVTMEEILRYFPERNQKVERLLKLIAATPGGPQRLELMTLDKLEAYYNPELGMTSFGDAANGMLPHIAGSMSTGFIGATTFLHSGLNPLIDRLSQDATNQEIADLMMEASALYDVTHRPLAQKLVDFSKEQGPLWSGGITDAEELSKRPRFLWASADAQK